MKTSEQVVSTFFVHIAQFHQHPSYSLRRIGKRPKTFGLSIMLLPQLKAPTFSVHRLSWVIQCLMDAYKVTEYRSVLIKVMQRIAFENPPLDGMAEVGVVVDMALLHLKEKGDTKDIYEALPIASVPALRIPQKEQAVLAIQERLDQKEKPDRKIQVK